MRIEIGIESIKPNIVISSRSCFLVRMCSLKILARKQFISTNVLLPISCGPCFAANDKSETQWNADVLMSSKTFGFEKTQQAHCFYCYVEL